MLTYPDYWGTATVFRATPKIKRSERTTEDVQSWNNSRDPECWKAGHDVLDTVVGTLEQEMTTIIFPSIGAASIGFDLGQFKKIRKKIRK